MTEERIIAVGPDDEPFPVERPTRASWGRTSDIRVPRSWIPAAGEHLPSSFRLGGRTLMMPAEYYPLFDWLRRLHYETLALTRATELHARQTHDLNAWFMRLRALSGLSELIADHGAGNVYPDDLERRGRAQRVLHTRARTLQEQVNRHREQFSDPVNYYETTYVRERAIAGRILEMLDDQTHARILGRYAADRGRGWVQKSTFMYMIGAAIDEAVVAVAKSPLHEGIARRCSSAAEVHGDRIRNIVREHPGIRSSSRDTRESALRDIEFNSVNMLDVAASWANLIGGTFGNMPLGSDSAAQAYASVVVSYNVLHTRTWGRAGPTLVDRHMEWWLQGCGSMTDAEMGSIRRAVQSGTSDDVHAARSLLQDRFQTAERFNRALVAFAVFQLAYTVGTTVWQDDHEVTGRDVFDTAVVAAQTGSVMIYTIARSGAAVSAVERSAVQRSAMSMARVIESCDVYATSFLAVINIVDGALLVAEGTNEQNALTQTIGVLTIGSAACTMTAAVATAAGWTSVGAVAGPVGVALGLVAATVVIGQAVYEGTRNAAVQTFEQLNSAIANSSAHRLDTLQPVNEAFDAVVSWMRDHFGDDFFIGYHGDTDLTRRQLAALGFNAEQVNQICPLERF